MTDATCPWCEAQLRLASADAPEQTCAECLTTWSYEDDPVELALAA